MKYFTLSNAIRHILKKRDEEKNERDIVFIIYGKTRSGKSTLGLRMVDNWMRYMWPELQKKYPKDMINQTSLWEKIFKNNFAHSARDAMDRISKLNKKDLLFIDEGLDVASSRRTMTSEVTNLLHLLNKSGSKQLFTIVVTPSFKLFEKHFFYRSHYLLHIPGEPTNKGNYANMLSNYRSPALAEENPFGLNTMFDKIKKKTSDEAVRNIILRNHCYVGDVFFRKVDKPIYDLYDKLVKKPQQDKVTYAQNVPAVKYNQLWYKYANLLYNLRFSTEASRAQLIRDIGYDKFGNKILTEGQIKDIEGSISKMENPPKYFQGKDSSKGQVSRK